jgi:hypothetical protein
MLEDKDTIQKQFSRWRLSTKNTPTNSSQDISDGRVLGVLKATSKI